MRIGVQPEPVEGQPAMRRSDAVEAAAMAHALDYERARGWQVEDVSAEARGHDWCKTRPTGWAAKRLYPRGATA